MKASDEETRFLLQGPLLGNLVRAWRLEPDEDPAVRDVSVPEDPAPQDPGNEVRPASFSPN